MLNPKSITCFGSDTTATGAATNLDQSIATAVLAAQAATDLPNQVEIIPTGFIYDTKNDVYLASATVLYGHS